MASKSSSCRRSANLHGSHDVICLTELSKTHLQHKMNAKNIEFKNIQRVAAQAELERFKEGSKMYTMTSINNTQMSQP